jgi:hypothetical protein
MAERTFLSAGSMVSCYLFVVPEEIKKLSSISNKLHFNSCLATFDVYLNLKPFYRL